MNRWTRSKWYDLRVVP